ncbi:MAG: NlpC/P60 family protein [Nitrososphaerales archaeon]
MTDVEILSTAPMGGKRPGLMLVRVAFAGAVVALLSTSLFQVALPASGDPLSSDQAQASQIAAQLQADSARVDTLSQQYEEAQGRVQQLDSQIQQTKDQIAADQAQVQKDQVNLRHQAIDAYVSNDEENDVASLFTSGNEKAVVAGQYRAVANANVSDAIDNLNIAKRTLGAQQQQLQTTQGQAQSALNNVASSRQQAQAVVNQQQSILVGLKGRIASLVAQQQAAQQSSQQSAFVSRASASASLPNLPAAGGAAGAVQAAKSQLGVPYRWGAESPGSGFDCSGLTQWSWGRAGVGIPRTAQAQYDAIAHVSLGDLQPGDLLFWGDGTGGIYHVAMYVGGGDVIQAPQTGQDVQIDPIWDSQLVGAGRP